MHLGKKIFTNFNKMSLRIIILFKNYHGLYKLFFVVINFKSIENNKKKSKISK